MCPHLRPLLRRSQTHPKARVQPLRARARRLAALAAALALATSAATQPHSFAQGRPTAATSPGPGWHLLWSDEFNGPDSSAPDPAKWSVVTGGNGFGNRELETYTARRENLRVEHGDLILEARHEPYTGADGIARPYTSARLQTLGHFTAGPSRNPAHGHLRIAARMQLPLGQGLWPAFWMLGADLPTAGWPRSGEIDILENIGDPHRVYGTLHGPGYSGAHGLQSHYDLPAPQAVQYGFHTYAIDWRPNQLQFLVDGHIYATRTPHDLPPGTPWVYNHPFFLLLNLAVGGAWPGNPNATTKFPQELKVDWVRVWQRQSST